MVKQITGDTENKSPAKKKKYVPSNKGNYKLNDEIEDIIVGAIQGGNYIETASALAGISKTTLYAWLKRGARYEQAKDDGKEPDKDDERFYEFYQKVNQAMAFSEANDVQNLDNMSKNNWVISAWRLERRFPERWSRRVVDRHGETNEPININVKIIK
jgi:hypothetical protein